MYPRIRSLREDKDLTQTEVAQYLFCSQCIYSRYERGVANIPTTILCRLAVMYDTSIDYLLGLTDVRQPYPRSQQQQTS